MSFGSVYPHYVTKVEKKGRTKQDLHTVIEWLTGYSEKDVESLIGEDANFETFFQNCQLNPNVHLITGVICGYRVEDMDDGVLKKCRYLDKLVDELARGKKMESILRTEG